MEEQEFQLPVGIFDLPREQQPAWFKIFYYTFNVKIEQAHLYSEEEISTYGVPSSGDPSVDREMALERMWVPAVLAQVVEWHRQGLRLEFHSTQDMVEIYDIIQQHLADWREELSSDWPRQPNLEDLQALEALAHDVYKRVRGEIGIREAKEDVTQRLLHIGVNPMTGGGEELIRQQRNEAEYKPLVPNISAALQRRKQWR